VGSERQEPILSTTESPIAEQTRELATIREELGQQTRLFDTMLSSIADLAYILNREKRFTYVNEALLDLWQKKREEVLGKNFVELNYPEELADRLNQQIETVFETGQSLRDETPYTGAVGTPGHYKYVFVPVLGNDGQVEAVVGSAHDITERRKMEAALLAGAGHTRDILESITDAFFSLDRDWRFTYVNEQTERLLDRPRTELLGKVLWEEYPGLLGSEFERVYLSAAHEGIISSITTFFPDHNRWYDVHTYPAPQGIAVYFRNATDQVQAEEERTRHMRQPVMDGLEASERILAATSVCIVMLTAFSEEEYQQKAQALGACGYVIKPVTSETLMPELEAALAKFHSRS
jgi:PAS domain S-box-containing protein